MEQICVKTGILPTNTILSTESVIQKRITTFTKPEKHMLRFEIMGTFEGQNLKYMYAFPWETKKRKNFNLSNVTQPKLANGIVI